MFGFWRRFKKSRTTLDTNGSSQAKFVKDTLDAARQYALDNNVKVGEEFTYTIKDIPVGISSPHEISFGLVEQAFEYGLSSEFVFNEQVKFVRLV